MDSVNIKDVLKGVLIVPIGLAMVLVPFSLLIGWNLVTLFVFWFVFIPALAFYLPVWLSKTDIISLNP